MHVNVSWTLIQINLYAWINILLEYTNCNAILWTCMFFRHTHTHIFTHIHTFTHHWTAKEKWKEKKNKINTSTILELNNNWCILLTLSFPFYLTFSQVFFFFFLCCVFFQNMYRLNCDWMGRFLSVIKYTSYLYIYRAFYKVYNTVYFSIQVESFMATKMHTHTHTHPYIYIYIWINLLSE